MSPSPSRSGRQLATIAQAAPFVMAQRLADMAWAAQPLTGQDQREWNRMLSEKGVAAMEGWWAMVNATCRAPFSSGLWSLWSNPWQRWAGLTQAGDRILAAGLKPVAKTVSANRSRLAKRRRSKR